MSKQLHSFSCLFLCFLLAAVNLSGAEVPGAGYVPDPEIEKLIDTALDQDKATAFPAQKRLRELGTAAERALNYKLFAEKSMQSRRPYADLIARCCEGRVGYRVTLELLPDGSGALVLESDRTMLAECAHKNDRLAGKPERDFPEDELRRNPYSKVDLSKYIGGAMKFNQGSTQDVNGRIIANGEVCFSNFDDFAAFATSFDRAGYHMLNSISLYDNNDLRTLHFKKNAEADRNKAANFLLMFHDVKWEFVLDFKGQLKSNNASKVAGAKYVWRFNCAQMLGGEAEIEASFDPRAGVKPVSVPTQDPQNNIPTPPGQSAPPANAPIAVVAKKVIHVAVGKPYNAATEANPNGPETIAVLDGTPSLPKNAELAFQWSQIAGIPLNQPAQRMTKPILRMRFYEVGSYKFELTVTQNGSTSAPSEIEVVVDEAVVNSAIANNAGGDGSAAINRTSELQPGKTPSPSAPKNEMRVVPPSPSVASQQGSFIPIPSKEILLSEIRREEAAYYAQRSEKSVAVSNVTPSNPVDPTTAPFVPVLPSKPVVDVNSGITVASAKNVELDEIRREEEQFNRTRPARAPLPVSQPDKITTPAPKDSPDTSLAVPKNGNAEAPSDDLNKKAEAAKAALLKQKQQEEEAKAKADAEAKSRALALQTQLEEEKKKEAASAEAKRKETELADAKRKETELADAKRKEAELAEAKKKAAEMALKTETIKPLDAVIPPAPVASTDGAASLPNADKLMKAGQYSAAVTMLKPLAQANPKDEAVQMAYGLALFEAAERPDGFERTGTSAAMDVFNEIIQNNNTNAQAYMLVGHCNGRLERDQDRIQYYRQGISLAKPKVSWEIRWYSGNKNLKEKDFPGALESLIDAEKVAIPAGIKDPRLLRDLAAAFHANKKDDEAIRRVNTLVELGYTPDATLVAELNKVSPGAIKVPDNGTVTAPNTGNPVATATQNTANGVNPGTSSFDPVPNKPVQPEATAQGTQPIPPPDATTNTSVASGTGAKTVDPNNKQKTVSDLEKMDSKNIKTSERPTKPTTRPEAQPIRARKTLPPIPETFAAAMDAGKRAFSNGRQFMQKIEEEQKKNDDASKPQIEAFRNEAQDYWDEAEAMFRGAWELKPDDAGVKEQFNELAKQVGVVALVKSPLLISKPNGLVVLNAEPSIVFPEGKTMYYAWQQVDGKELNLRREDLDKKTVGLRIKNPGIYKFELVVSDGSRGGNPVTVIVEVR